MRFWFERQMRSQKSLALYLLFLIAMILSGSLAPVANAQQIDSALYARAFPGADVGLKVTAAVNACNPDRSVPCLIVIDASLAAYAPGTLPDMCANCYLADYRNGFPWAGASSGCGPLSGDNTSTDCGFENNTGATVNGDVQTYGTENDDGGVARFLVAIGNGNAESLVSSREDVAIGDNNLEDVQAVDAINIGDQNGQGFDEVQDFIAIGDEAGLGSGSVSDLICIGDVTCEGILDGSNVLIEIGLAAGEISNGLSGSPSENIGIGDSADDNDTGSENIAIGDSALDGGGGSTRNNTGGNNVAIGFDAIRSNTTGGDNVAIGDQPGCVGCTGGSAGNGNLTGSHNVWIGDKAGQSMAGSSEVDYSVAIGYHAQNDQTNEVVIGSPAAAGAGATAKVVINGTGDGCLGSVGGVVTGNGGGCTGTDVYLHGQSIGCSIPNSTDGTCTTSPISFGTTFADTSYTLQLTPMAASGAFISATIVSKSTTQFSFAITCTFNCSSVGTVTLDVHAHHD